MFFAGIMCDKAFIEALQHIKLGNQYVLKTEKTLDNLISLDRCYICPIERASFNKAGEIESNTSLNKAILSKSKYKNQGKYISELLK